jgi:iron complex outermembrane receptor protein
VAMALSLAAGIVSLAARAETGDAGDAALKQPGTQEQSQSSGLTQLNDIIVTAQRKEERLQDVGISVTALTSDELQQMGVSNAVDLVRAVPSLKFNAFSSAGVVWNIRGVSQNDYGDQQEPPVAVYQDDSYSSSINTSSFPTFDLARVETLRGPQGTLFGRNATGGAIQFISNKPTKDWEGYATATYGAFSDHIFEGALSGPLLDNLQFRLAGIKEQSAGYIKDIIPGMGNFGAQNHYALRGILAWQPVDGTNVDLTVRYLRAPHERSGGAYAFQPACPNAQLQGAVEGPNQSCAFWGNQPGTDANNYRNDGITPSRGGNPWTTAATNNPNLGPGQLGTDRRTFDSTLRIDSSIAGYDLVSVTDYQFFNKSYEEDDDSSPQQDSNFFEDSQVMQFSQELRASHTYGNHDVTAGAFYMHLVGSYTGAFPIYFIGYIPSVQWSEGTTSYAGFAQDEWKFADDFKLTAGMRYWHDQRVASYYGAAPASALDAQPPVTIIFNPSQVFPGGSNLTPADADGNYSGVTSKLELDYKPQEGMLFYASWNRGGKSGGFTFSTGTPFAPGQVAFLNGIPYKPETLNDFELGSKITLGGTSAINASVFHYNYGNYQAFAQLGTTQTIVNQHATANGLEVELNSRPITGLLLQLGTSFESSRVEHILLPDLTTVVDHDLPQAPHFSGNASANYEFPLASGMASVGSNIAYQSHMCFTILCAPVENERAYAVTDLRAGFKPAGGHWEFQAYVHNLFQRAYRVYAFDGSQFSGVALGVYGPPRTWGVTATYRFGAK